MSKMKISTCSALLLGLIGSMTCFANLVFAKQEIFSPSAQNNTSLATPQIVGGQQAETNDWPWMTAYVFTFQQVATNLRVDGTTYSSTNFTGIKRGGSSSGLLVSCGLGDSICNNAQGKVCLIERGEINFSEKALNCEVSGGVAAIIYNNEGGQISGTFGTNFSGTIPVVAVNQVDGLILLEKVGKTAEVTVTLSSNVQQEASCGASFLGGKWVLIAAHCVDSADAVLFKMNVGEYDLSDGGENATEIANIYVHPQYDADAIDYDIALVELVESVDAPAIQLASKATTDEYAAEHSSALVAGWGGTTGYAPGEGPTSNFPNVLHEVELNLTTNDECRSTLADSLGIRPQNAGITSQMICATQPATGQGTCQGDSGGPLIVQTSTGPEQVGIVSWGIGCAEQGYPGVFTRVAEFADWLNTIQTGIAITQKQDFGISPINISQTSRLSLANNSQSIVNLTFSISGSSAFSIIENNCTNLAAGASCDVAIEFSPPQSGNYSGTLVINSNDVSVVTSEALLQGQAISQATHLSGVAGTTNSKLTWYSGGDALWTANPTDTGVQSGNIANNQESILTAYIEGSGTLSFDWRVSSEENEDDPSEPFDALYIYVNNVLYDFISGVDGEFEDFGDITLEDQSNIVTWVYSKDPGASEGEDKGYIRNVVFTPTEAVSLPTPNNPSTSSSSGGGSSSWLSISLLALLVLVRINKAIKKSKH